MVGVLRLHSRMAELKRRTSTESQTEFVLHHRRRFRLESIHPGFTVAQIREHTGFDYDDSSAPRQTPSPSREELSLLRGPVKNAMTENYPEFGKRVWQARGAT